MQYLLFLVVFVIGLGTGMWYVDRTPDTVPPSSNVESTTSGVDSTSTGSATPAPPPSVQVSEPTPQVSEPTLDLSHQHLTKVPDYVFSRVDVRTLNLSHNALSGALPAEIRQLTHLEYLDLSHNQFTGVPAEIGQLTELRYLNLSHNQITGLPYEIGNLKKLETLDLTGTAYAAQDLVKIKEGLPSTVHIIGEH
jgi:Leucine rich repeat/Leucine Rich repeats (2 copies)